MDCIFLGRFVFGPRRAAGGAAEECVVFVSRPVLGLSPLAESNNELHFEVIRSSQTVEVSNQQSVQPKNGLHV